MLKIKSDQIRVFQEDADEAFVRRVADYVRAHHADADVRMRGTKQTVSDVDDETLRAATREGLRRAKVYGISWKSTLLSFVVLMVLTAPNFDAHPKAAAFFKAHESVDDEKFESLMDQMTDEDWDAVEKIYDERAWNI